MSSLISYTYDDGHTRINLRVETLSASVYSVVSDKAAYSISKSKRELDAGGADSAVARQALATTLSL
jgi:hypothetical protein